MALTACAGPRPASAPTPPPARAPVTPPSPAATASLEGVADARIEHGPPAEVLRRVVRAYELAGHACTFDKDGDAVCDQNDSSTPTLVFSATEHEGLTAISITTYRFPLENGMTCALAAPTLASVRVASSDVRAECTDEKLVVGGRFLIARTGTTVRELNASARTALVIASLVALRLSVVLRQAVAP